MSLLRSRGITCCTFTTRLPKKSILRPAGHVKVGDFLLNADQELMRVEAIQRVQRTGAYALLTTHGVIVVNSIVTSNYASLPIGFHQHLSFQEQHWLKHAAFAPYRAFCFVTGCENESYDETTGLSMLVAWFLPLVGGEDALLGRRLALKMVHFAKAVMGSRSKCHRFAVPRLRTITYYKSGVNKKMWCVFITFSAH